MKEQTWSIRSSADFGRAIRDIRSTTGRTQADLATDIGLTRDYVAKIETGRSNPLLEHYLRALRRQGANITVTFSAPEPTQGEILNDTNQDPD